MADEPTFAQQEVTEQELTESDRIRKRIQDYKAQLSPNTLQVIQIMLESQLKSGLLKPADLDAVIMLRDEVNKASIEYNTQVQNAQRRLEDLSATEMAEKVAQEEAKIAQIIESRDVERQRRKSVEDRLAQMEAVLASHGISMDLNQDGVVGLKEGQVADELTEEEQQQVDDIVEVEKENITTEPSRAFQMARSLNPEPSESQKMQDELEPIYPPSDPMESWDKPSVSDEQMKEAVEALEQEEFENKIAETKKSFKEWDDANKQESFDFKPSGTTTESFMDEVERVNEVAEADELLEEEPQSSLPKVSAGQVNEEQAQELAEENPEFILSRESVKMIDEEPEEEYEEVTIPSESELKSMTKAQINQVAVGLEFDVPTSLTKNKMIESFLVQTEEFIQSLQDSGEFVSASDSSDDKNNIRDGGYF